MKSWSRGCLGLRSGPRSGRTFTGSGFLSPGRCPGRVTFTGSFAGRSTDGLAGAGLAVPFPFAGLAVDETVDEPLSGFVTDGLAVEGLDADGFVTDGLVTDGFADDGFVAAGLTSVAVRAGLATEGFGLESFDFETAGLEVVVREVVELVERLVPVVLLFCAEASDWNAVNAKPSSIAAHIVLTVLMI